MRAGTVLQLQTRDRTRKPANGEVRAGYVECWDCTELGVSDVPPGRGAPGLDYYTMIMHASQHRKKMGRIKVLIL